MTAARDDSTKSSTSYPRRMGSWENRDVKANTANKSSGSRSFIVWMKVPWWKRGRGWQSQYRRYISAAARMISLEGKVLQKLVLVRWYTCLLNLLELRGWLLGPGLWWNCGEGLLETGLDKLLLMVAWLETTFANWASTNLSRSSYWVLRISESWKE